MPQTKTIGKSNATLQEEVQATLKRLEAKDPGLKQLLKKAYGFAVFPSVGKAALVVGGAYGRGLVYERGKMVGHATIGQFTLGVPLVGTRSPRSSSSRAGNPSTASRKARGR